MTAIPHYNSGYLAHLQALSLEAKQRIANIPPFTVLLGAALFAHIAIIAPIYVLDVSDEMPPETQVQVAFGVDHMKNVALEEHIEAVPATDTIAAPAAPPKAPSRSISDNLDAMLGTAPKQSRNANAIRQPSAPSLEDNATPRIAPRNRRVTPQRPTRRSGIAARAASPAQIREITSKYERALSGWIDKHKIYPASAYQNGVEGRVVLRLRITRNGSIVYSAIDRSSGNTVLDRAVLETAAKAAPMPPVPTDYPGANQVEFLIPIRFSL